MATKTQLPPSTTSLSLMLLQRKDSSDTKSRTKCQKSLHTSKTRHTLVWASPLTIRTTTEAPSSKIRTKIGSKASTKRRKTRSGIVTGRTLTTSRDRLLKTFCLLKVPANNNINSKIWILLIKSTLLRACNRRLSTKGTKDRTRKSRYFLQSKRNKHRSHSYSNNNLCLHHPNPSPQRSSLPHLINLTNHFRSNLLFKRHRFNLLSQSHHLNLNNKS
jgi:hypothetical protein